MLHKETITPGTLAILIDLMNDEVFQDFFLVGGTALSLQIGHRISIDLDLFSLTEFDEKKMLEYLTNSKSFILSMESKHTLKGEIGGIQVDFLTHAYPLVEKLEFIEGVRMAGLMDIAAMKLNAISGNGTRLKDFIDVAFLSSHIPLSKMLSAYQTKYSVYNPFSVLKSITYFEDINFNEPIHYLIKSIPWKAIEKRLKEMIKSPEKVFPDLL